MSQSDFGTIVPSTKSGTQLATDLNNWRDAVHSAHKGSSRPSYATAGTFWVNDAATPWILYCYDGADDISLGTINATTNVFTPSGTTTSFTDTDFELKDNTDNSKKLKLELSGISTGTTRTITLPDVNFTPAVAGAVGSSGLTQNTSTLLGRTTAGVGSVEELTVGANLTLSEGVLSANPTTWTTEPTFAISGPASLVGFNLPSTITDIELFLYNISTNGTSPLTLTFFNYLLADYTSGYLGTTSTLTSTTSSTRYTNYIALTSTVVATATYGGKISLHRVSSTDPGLWLITGSITRNDVATNYVINSTINIPLPDYLYGISLQTAGGVNTFDSGSVSVIRYR